MKKALTITLALAATAAYGYYIYNQWQKEIAKWPDPLIKRSLERERFARMRSLIIDGEWDNFDDLSD